jgi:hypothetical protein
MPVQLLQLWLLFAWSKAKKNALRLRIGAYFIKRGANVTIGQKITYRATKNMKKRPMYINNLYYNFGLNKITHTMSKKPIS